MDQSKNIMVRTRAVMFYEGKLLVVSHSSDSSFYALPGGHLEWGEDIYESLSREIVEELGIVPEIGRLLFINNFIEKEVNQSIEFFFEITNASDYLDIKNLKGTHRHELVDVCWVSKDDGKRILPEPIQKYLEEGSLMSDTVRFIK